MAISSTTKASSSAYPLVLPSMLPSNWLSHPNPKASASLPYCPIPESVIWVRSYTEPKKNLFTAHQYYYRRNVVALMVYEFPSMPSSSQRTFGILVKVRCIVSLNLHTFFSGSCPSITSSLPASFWRQLWSLLGVGDRWFRRVLLRRSWRHQVWWDFPGLSFVSFPSCALSMQRGAWYSP